MNNYNIMHERFSRHLTEFCHTIFQFHKHPNTIHFNNYYSIINNKLPTPWDYIISYGWYICTNTDVECQAIYGYFEFYLSRQTVSDNKIWR